MRTLPDDKVDEVINIFVPESGSGCPKCEGYSLERTGESREENEIDVKVVTTKKIYNQLKCKDCGQYIL